MRTFLAFLTFCWCWGGAIQIKGTTTQEVIAASIPSKAVVQAKQKRFAVMCIRSKTKPWLTVGRALHSFLRQRDRTLLRLPLVAGPEATRALLQRWSKIFQNAAAVRTPITAKLFVSVVRDVKWRASVLGTRAKKVDRKARPTAPSDWLYKTSKAHYTQRSDAQMLQDLLRQAKRYAGVTERGRLYKERPRYLFSNGRKMPWCANFAKVLLMQTGIRLPGSWVMLAGAPYMFEELRQWVEPKWRYQGHTPSPGDLVFFDSLHKPGTIVHVGFVSHVKGNTVYTIEGNYSKKVYIHEWGYNLYSGLMPMRKKKKKQRRIHAYLSWIKARRHLQLPFAAWRQWRHNYRTKIKAKRFFFGLYKKARRQRAGLATLASIQQERFRHWHKALGRYYKARYHAELAELSTFQKDARAAMKVSHRKAWTTLTSSWSTSTRRERRCQSQRQKRSKCHRWERAWRKKQRRLLRRQHSQVWRRLRKAQRRSYAALRAEKGRVLRAHRRAYWKGRYRLGKELRVWKHKWRLRRVRERERALLRLSRTRQFYTWFSKQAWQFTPAMQQQHD